MELEKAIEILLDANNGNRPVPVTKFVEASNIVLDVMRNEITTSQIMKWCIDHRPTSQRSVD